MKSWLLSSIFLLFSPLLKTVVAEDPEVLDANNNRGLVDLIDLVPFDVQIALTEDLGIQTFELTDLVTAWLNDSFERRLVNKGYANDRRYAVFDSVILLNKGSNNGRRQLDQQDPPDNESSTTTLGVLYTARFDGVALFARDESRPFKIPTGEVLEMQRQAVKEDDALLLQALVESNARGLGDPVAAVNAYLSPVWNDEDSGDDDQNDQLQLVIIIAVCVACVAFVCLVGAIVWAWRNDRQNRAAYRLESTNTNSSTQKKKALPSADQDRTGSDTTEDDVGTPEKLAASPRHHLNYFSQTEGADDERIQSNSRYPDSIISEDISSALSAYYRSGLGGSGLDFVRHPPNNSDAVSVSSMESYGYSLDGRSYTVEAMGGGGESVLMQRENSEGRSSTVDDIEEEQDDLILEPERTNPPGRRGLEEP